MTTDFEFALSQIAESDRLVRNMSLTHLSDLSPRADGKLP